MTKEQRQTIVKFLDAQASKHWSVIGDYMTRAQNAWGRGEMSTLQHETFNLHMAMRKYNTFLDMRNEVAAFDEPIESER